MHILVSLARSKNKLVENKNTNVIGQSVNNSLCYEPKSFFYFIIVLKTKTKKFLS